MLNYMSLNTKGEDKRFWAELYSAVPDFILLRSSS